MKGLLQPDWYQNSIRDIFMAREIHLIILLAPTSIISLSATKNSRRGKILCIWPCRPTKFASHVTSHFRENYRLCHGLTASRITILLFLRIHLDDPPRWNFFFSELDSRYLYGASMNNNQTETTSTNSFRDFHYSCTHTPVHCKTLRRSNRKINLLCICKKLKEICLTTGSGKS